MKIPRILHHIWLGPNPLPDEHEPWIESWKRHHPKWEHRLWTEDNLPLNPLRPEILERLRAPVERADILRLEILYSHGGVYLDTDLECLRPLDDVLEGQSFVGVTHKHGRITNTAIAAIPAHPLLDRAMHEIKPLDAYWTGSSDTLKDVAGPRLLQKLIPDFPDILLLEPYVSFPPTPRSGRARLRSTTWPASGTTRRRCEQRCSAPNGGSRRSRSSSSSSAALMA